MYINKLYKNAKTCKKSTSTIVKKKNGQKVAFIQLVPKIKVLKLRIGADWCRVRTLHADVNPKWSYWVFLYHHCCFISVS